MAKLTVNGLEDFSTRIHALGEKGEDVAKAAVYEGAKVLTEAVKQAIRELPEEPWHFVRPGKGEELNVITPADKEDLINGLGIAHFDSTGGKVTTAIGFNGYSSHPTKKYTSGVPLALIARSIESGSSVRRKLPFMRRAANNAKERAQQAMVQAAYAKIEEITK